MWAEVGSSKEQLQHREQPILSAGLFEVIECPVSKLSEAMRSTKEVSRFSEVKIWPVGPIP